MKAQYFTAIKYLWWMVICLAKKIRVAVSGIGNCFSSLIQGIYFYKGVDSNNETVPGLMHNVMGGYKISDIEFVAAFDVDKRKV